MSRLIVAFESEAAARRVCDLLAPGAITPRSVCRTGAEVIRAVRYMGSGVVICSAKLSDMTASDLYEDLEGKAYMLVVGKPQELDLCENRHVFRLALPCNRYDLAASVRMLTQLEEMNRPGAPSDSEDRALISAAKTLLMERDGLSEPEAHRKLQKDSMASGQKMSQLARQIIAELQSGD